MLCSAREERRHFSVSVSCPLGGRESISGGDDAGVQKCSGGGGGGNWKRGVNRKHSAGWRMAKITSGKAMAVNLILVSYSSFPA